MTASERAPLYISIGSTVVAIDRATGDEIWRRELESSSLVTAGMLSTMLVTSDAIYVGAHGELFCLSPSTGEIRWHNRLKGLGTAFIVFGGGDGTVALPVVTQAALLAAVNAAT